MVRQADDIFESSGDANQHTPGWTKAVVVGQVRGVYCRTAVVLWLYGVV